MFSATLVYDLFDDPFAEEQCQAGTFTIQQKWGTGSQEDETLRSNDIHTCCDAFSLLGKPF